jgi:hypothetical protein
MTTEQFKLVKQAARELEIPYKEYPNYSGRNMFGKATMGVVFDGAADTDMIEEWIDNNCSFELRSDNMGKGYILY